MTHPADEIHIEEERARAGSTPHILRYILFFSLIIAIAVLSVIWMTGAYTAPDDTGGYSDTRRAVAEGN